MFARITSDLMNNNLLAALNQTEQSQNDALSQVESGRSVNLPSDNPAAAALYSNNVSANSTATQFLQNINSLTGNLQVGDSALSSAVTMLNRAVTLGTEGGSGTLSTTQQQALGQEVGQIQQQMIAVANTTFQGSYVFGGTASSQPPYAADPSSPDGVTYSGNDAVNQVQIAPGAQTAANVPGSALFQNANGSVFQALQNLKTALNSGDAAGAQSAVSQLNQSIDQLGQQRVFYGATVDQLNTTQTFLTNEQMNLAQQQTTLVGANLASSITNLSSAETARSAILAAGSRISQSSLLNQSSS